MQTSDGRSACVILGCTTCRSLRAAAVDGYSLQERLAGLIQLFEPAMPSAVG